MPNHPSAIKRHRQSLKHRDANRMVKSSMRTAITKIKTAVSAGDLSTARDILRKAEAEISRAGTRNIIHRKNASRKVSRLASLIAQSYKKK